MPSHLKLHLADANFNDVPPAITQFNYDALSAAFRRATGWHMQDAHTSGPLTPTSCAVTVRDLDERENCCGGEVVLERLGCAAIESSRAVIPRDCALELAETIGNLADLLHRTQDTLTQREGELATAIPVVSHADQEPYQLASRLEAILRGGAQAVNCQAAALYLLDDATSHLKLRSQWGLARDRFLLPPRALRHAKGDLEALVGHAVVLEDARALRHWNVPEEFPSSVCVPVSSPTVPFGTLWIFSSARRDFSSRETNLIEMVGGRIAAELDRDVLLREIESLRTGDPYISPGNDTPGGESTNVAPLVKGWEIAAGVNGHGTSSGNLCEWFVHPDGAVAVSLATAQSPDRRAALTAAALGGALRALRDDIGDPGQLLRRLNQILWTGSAGDQWSSLFHGVIQPELGEIEFAVAGPVEAFLLRPGGSEPIAPDTICLGVDTETEYVTRSQWLAPGEALLLYGGRSDWEPHEVSNQRAAANKAADALCEQIHLSAQQLATMVRDDDHHPLPGPDDRPPTVLIVKRAC